MLLTKRGFSLLLSVLLLTLAVITPSHAALNAAVAGAFTTLSTDALALIDLAWTVVVPVVSGFIVLRLFKSTASKAV